MTTPIDDTTIEAIRNYICLDSTFYNLGMKLGYNYEVLQIYRDKNYGGGKATYQGTKELLQDWMRNTPPEEQRSKLRKALEDVHLGTLAMQLFPDLDEQQTQQQPGVTNTISASESSNVSGNTMIGQQTNVYNKSAPSAPVVHHHHTTHVKQAAPGLRPIFIQPPAQKRRATPSSAPPAKRSKVTQASTSKTTTSKQKKRATSRPKSTTQSVEVTSKKKTQRMSKKREPTTESTKKVSDKKNQAVKKKKTPKTNKPKSKTSKTSQKRATKYASSKNKSQTKKLTMKKKKPQKTDKPKSQKRARCKNKPKKSKKNMVGS